MEQSTGFWTAYLLCLFIFVLAIGILIAGEKFYVVHPPKGSIIIDSFKAMWIGLRSGANMGMPAAAVASVLCLIADNVAEAAKPSYQRKHGRQYKTPWNDVHIDDLKRGLAACRVFLFFPIYSLAFSQMLNNFISQGEYYLRKSFDKATVLIDMHTAGTMQLHGIPNDIMQNIDPIAVIVLIPVFDGLLYPSLRKIGLPFQPITRMTWGYVFGALAMAYAAVLQHWIYTSPPCYNAPLTCNASHSPNEVHVAAQTPTYLLFAVSEILVGVSGMEYAYTKAPQSLKSFVMSIFLLQSAIGSALGATIAPLAKDPNLVRLYAGLSVLSFTAAGLFWICFKHLNATEDSMNSVENNGYKMIGNNEADSTEALDLMVESRKSFEDNESEV